jgi:hydrogenase maturation factor
MSVKKENAEKILQDLKENNLPHSKMVGEVIEARNYKIKIY